MSEMVHLFRLRLHRKHRGKIIMLELLGVDHRQFQGKEIPQPVRDYRLLICLHLRSGQEVGAYNYFGVWLKNLIYPLIFFLWKIYTWKHKKTALCIYYIQNSLLRTIYDFLKTFKDVVVLSLGPADGNRSPTQNAVLEQSLNTEYNQMPPYTTKPPPYNAHPLMQSICNPPPPPPPHHQQLRPQHPSQAMQHYQVPISQTYQPPTSCPPWMNWNKHTHRRAAFFYFSIVAVTNGCYVPNATLFVLTGDLSWCDSETTDLFIIKSIMLFEQLLFLAIIINYNLIIWNVQYEHYCS